ncbi:MAG: hypothetical protein FWD89_04685 [Firmicutes bacterium]|nr:hypothetical protein [Bacillota bacterium]MCL2771577.1 hypothetical protein [Bacillota bacterium]
MAEKKKATTEIEKLKDAEAVEYEQASKPMRIFRFVAMIVSIAIIVGLVATTITMWFVKMDFSPNHISFSTPLEVRLSTRNMTTQYPQFTTGFMNVHEDDFDRILDAFQDDTQIRSLTALLNGIIRHGTPEPAVVTGTNNHLTLQDADRNFTHVIHVKWGIPQDAKHADGTHMTQQQGTTHLRLYYTQMMILLNTNNNGISQVTIALNTDTNRNSDSTQFRTQIRVWGEFDNTLNVVRGYQLP